MVERSIIGGWRCCVDFAEAEDSITRRCRHHKLDTVLGWNDDGKYDVASPTVRRARDDLDALHYILRAHMEELSQTERDLIHDAYLEEQPRDEIAARRGISLNT